MKRWSHLSIRYKLFLTFSFVISLTVAMISVVFYFNNVREMKQEVQSTSNILSRQFDKTLDLYIQDIERLSLAVFTDPVIQSSLIKHSQPEEEESGVQTKNVIYPQLFNHVYPRKHVESVSIYTNNGIVYEYTKKGQIEVGYYDKAEGWVEELDQKGKEEFLLLPTTKYSINGHEEDVISLVRHIYQIPNRKKIGSMKIQININALKDLFILSQDEMADHIRVLIMTDLGEVIYDNFGQLTGALNSSFDTSIFRKSSMIGSVKWNQAQYIYSFTPSFYTNWNTVVLVSNNMIVAKQHKILMYILYIGLIAIIVIGLLSFLLSHHITLPLKKMMIMMRRVERGDLHERMKPTGNAEIDLLSRVYNRMIDSINHLIKEVYELKLTEKNVLISALQAQINPHFLYNTLNIMKSISRVKGVDEVAEISESLGDLFKYSMRNVNQSVQLSEEINHVKNYMNIQYYRFGNRFQFTCEIPMEIRNASIPKLLIQPIIENAVNHGVSQVRFGGLIKLIGKKEDDVLIIRVEDNGVGMSQEKMQSLKELLSSTMEFAKIADEEKGIGLMNIQQRVRLLYGNDYGLTIDNNEGGGCTIILTLPYIIHSENEVM